ncbi:NUDIX hydrolase [Haloferax elongans ATCC BAA-1513]|uniref:NUDIX hydrolase n=1 Tax=Haloferax elongans ATCC BAA-1513 TaxID=1230453 RepID=M0HAS8_HALEO|nr:NUDIX domain-containing protein [Haloferax elongans]ELZ80224.1 NUDIX hydrolase [Haloferax elongans ATCC BAA-1513]
MSEIQVTVLGIVRRGDEYLVQHLTDPSAETFYRPIGGGVQFNEPSDKTLEREFDEELGISIRAGPVVGTIENRFTWNDELAHEIVIFREASFVDDALYERSTFDGIDAGGTIEYEATWETIEDLVAGPKPLYPQGLPRLLRIGDGEGHGHLDSPTQKSARGLPL